MTTILTGLVVLNMGVLGALVVVLLLEKVRGRSGRRRRRDDGKASPS